MEAGSHIVLLLVLRKGATNRYEPIETAFLDLVRLFTSCNMSIVVGKHDSATHDIIQVVLLVAQVLHLTRQIASGVESRGLLAIPRQGLRVRLRRLWQQVRKEGTSRQ